MTKKLAILFLPFFALVSCCSNKVVVKDFLEIKNLFDEPSYTINPLTPYDGEMVYLVNDEMASWLSHYSKGSSQSHIDNIDHFAPKAVTLSWETTGESLYNIVEIDTDSKFMNPISYVVIGDSVDIPDLYVAYQYYWRVTSVLSNKSVRSRTFKFTTVATPRTITIDGISNTRDIGGTYTTFGRRVKQGLVYRCGQTDLVTEQGKHDVRYRYNIKTDLDLRSTSEISYDTSKGSILGPTVNLINISAPSYTGFPNGLNDPEQNHINDYTFASEIKVFAHEENYPVIFHCAAGRDRTGTLACVLSALLGVLEEDLEIDYETSMFSVSGTLDNPIIETMLKTFDNIISYLYTFSGTTLAEKTENYLLTYGVSEEEISFIRNFMLEE